MVFKVGVVCTSTISVDRLKALFKEIMPEVEQITITDDSIVREIIQNVKATPQIIARLSAYYQICERLGCCCILNECTSVAEAADIAEKTVNIPVFRIDYPMAKKAALTGNKIGIVATAVSTQETSLNTFKRAAKDVGNDNAAISVYFCEGAHKELFQNNDRIKHDKIVRTVAEKAASECDVIALAQGSMAPLAAGLADLGVPVLTSPYSGVMQVKEYIDTIK